MRSVRLVLPFALAVILSSAVTPAQGPVVYDVFDDQIVHDVRLSINSKDLQKLRAAFLSDTAYPADFTWQGVRVRNVAVRSRGWGSRNPNKLGLRIDFDRYVPMQQFAGLSALVLDNLWQDPALIREPLAMRVFERMGEPAPREAWARVYINNVFQGLYSMVEPIDERFLDRTLGESDGYLHEYRWLWPYYGEDLGHSLGAYAPMFEPKTHETALADELFGPIRDLWQEVNGPLDEEWRNRVETLLDLDQFVTHLAIETCIAEHDGLLGQGGMNNFFLYRSADSTRHRFIVWDKDNSFLFTDGSVLDNVDQNVLAQRALADAELRDRYLGVLETCARVALEDEWLLGEVDRQAALIDAVVRADRQKQFSDEEFDLDIEYLRRWARERPAEILDELAILRGMTWER